MSTLVVIRQRRDSVQHGGIPGGDAVVALVGYPIVLVSFVIADMVWLGLMAPRFYRPILGDIALSDVNYPAAVAFYLLYPVGLMIFAVQPAVKSGSLAYAATHGALFGFFTYMTYDLTNQSTLRNWTLSLTVVDVLWGTALGAISATVGSWIVSKLT